MLPNSKIKQIGWLVLFYIGLISASLATASNPPSTVHIKILGINDFHGQISAGRLVNKEPVGGASVLAAYLKQAQSGMEDRTLITIMGDQVGASPPSSGLLNDEPSILFTNTLGNSHCNPEARMDPQCNLVATVGNHEFDKGQKAMMDLIYGTSEPPTEFWIPLPYYPGASYPYISANIVDENTEKPLFPPYVIKSVRGIKVAFIGAILKDAAGSMFPENAKGVKFLDVATTINHYIPEVKAAGAEIIIALMHEGGNQVRYEGPTRADSVVQGKINQIVDQLDDDIDVVMGGHTHQFLNAYLPNHHGVKILVTQANSYSASFAEVDLEIDSQSHKVTQKSAQIITTFANQWPGTNANEQAQEIVTLAEEKVAPIINSYVGTLQTEATRRQNESGESTIGNLIADALRVEEQAEIGVTNPHGLRSDLETGTITWGSIYSVLPFSNKIVTVSLTGKDIYELFEQQWMGGYPNMLQISGITYTYDLNKPLGNRIINIQHQNKALDREKKYTIATTDFLASGGGIFSAMKKSKLIKIGDNDIHTVIRYIKKLKQPFSVSLDGRISKN